MVLLSCVTFRVWLTILALFANEWTKYGLVHAAFHPQRPMSNGEKITLDIDRRKVTCKLTANTIQVTKVADKTPQNVVVYDKNESYFTR